jgi:hypothetical protein
LRREQTVRDSLFPRSYILSRTRSRILLHLCSGAPSDFRSPSIVPASPPDLARAERMRELRTPRPPPSTQPAAAGSPTSCRSCREPPSPPPTTGLRRSATRDGVEGRVTRVRGEPLPPDPSPASVAPPTAAAPPAAVTVWREGVEEKVQDRG